MIATTHSVAAAPAKVGSTCVPPSSQCRGLWRPFGGWAGSACSRAPRMVQGLALGGGRPASMLAS